MKYGITYFRILKNFCFRKMKKWQIESSDIQEISEILFRVFSCPILPNSRNRKIRFKKLGKKFPIFRGLRVFDLAPNLSLFIDFL